MKKDTLKCLYQDFLKRKKKNPRFSLRAYAKYLAMSHGKLSEVFSNKRCLTPTLARRIMVKLDWSTEQKRLFLDAIEFESKAAQRKKLLARLKQIEAELIPKHRPRQ